MKGWIGPCKNPAGALNYCKKTYDIVEIGIYFLMLNIKEKE
jgi:hypothetical protein